MVPQNYQKLESEEQAKQMEKLIDIMEDDDIDSKKPLPCNRAAVFIESFMPWRMLFFPSGPQPCQWLW